VGPRVGLYIVAKKKTFLIVESNAGCVNSSHYT